VTTRWPAVTGGLGGDALMPSAYPEPPAAAAGADAAGVSVAM
jgi:hypothetical protein